jgi:4-hydroxybenzoate polyprenyltransferase
VFIAICAMAFMLEAYKLLHLPIQYDALVLFIGSSTCFIYMFIRLAAVNRIKCNTQDERWRFFIKYLPLMRFLTVLVAILSCILFFLLDDTLQLALLFPGIISLCYGISFQIGKHNWRLRDTGILKIFMICFVWAFTASILPALHAGLQVFSTQCMILFAAHYFFIFGITLPFDIKDLDIDNKDAVQTIPALLGIDTTYTLAFLSLFIASGLHCYLQHIQQASVNYCIPTGSAILIAGLTVYLTRRNRNNFIFFGLLDGMILLQFLLIYFYTN